MSDDALELLALDWANDIRERPLPHGMLGGWDDEHGVIYLSSRLSPVQRRCVLAHEISHARHRDVGCRADAWSERRADMDAARMLVSPVEYAMLERINDDPTWIAHESDLLTWVITAYRDLLHDRAA